MAKGNIFLGQGRGKIGDMVLYRRSGEQIARVRNRHPHNPRTNRQQYQRAIMYTVMRAYAAGKAIFDHAFQGKSVGEGNQRYFASKNSRLLRSQLADKLNALVAGDDTVLNAFVSGPRTLYAVPNRYLVSEGTLQQNAFTPTGAMVAALENETVAQYCARLGFVANDIFTLVMIQQGGDAVFTVAGAEDENGAVQRQSQFIFLRFFVKPSALTDTTVITAETTKAAFFELDPTSSSYGNPLATAMTTAPIIDDELPYEGANYASGVIRSRVNEDLRSTCYLTLTEWANERCGISAEYALDAWTQGTEALGDSGLILEGGDE